MKEARIRAIIREELARLNEFAPGKFMKSDTHEKVTMSDAEVSVALDDALRGRHASGRPFSSQFRSMLNESEESVDYGKVLESLDDDPRYRAGMITDGWDDEIKKMYQQGKRHEANVLKSIVLFTGGNVESVRDPEKFNVDNTKKIKFTDWVPEKNDYAKANKIMTQLATCNLGTRMRDAWVYRGLALDQDVIDNLRVGIEFHNLPLSSFSLDHSVAKSFSTMEARKGSKRRVQIAVENPEYGAAIFKFSVFPQEREFILGKRLEIVKVTRYDELRLICAIIP